ncbi:processive 1,2-diacylglycerol beta-glucosyltransferase [Clostridium acidisoli DSM 12555]|uniref:Processive 1,2-diacylglycerol beta-glucosyltransferase n=1 Tax=Clostridium acidisoli DSM 12555 TaxID=1121291 RepID=A0A1W1XFX5_9CLOT|nr:glycosyltransferase [Clostridium acidisoli]SMC22692.1 processive 1,2-diacylglycerol beta-glucosyltransferase [Clostridium acidisoli DSM 12555]
MKKNILIISSNHTGNGHKSITEALCEKFKMRENVNVHVVDGFSLGGKPLIAVGKSYGVITRNAEGLWDLIFDVSSVKPELINEIIEITIKEKFIKLIEEIKPDLILSVHPNFNGSIINLLDKYNYKIPVVTLIADLISISPLWADKRAEYIISPTVEAKDKCLQYGIPNNRIRVLGLPVRSRFHYNNITNLKQSKEDRKRLNCLIMSGGEGVGNMKKVANILLKNFDCNVNIIAGRNKQLKKKLELSLTHIYGDRVKVHGFVDNIQELMITSDIAFTRASPNVMLEVASCNVPFIITGALPGQEEGNPYFAEKYNLGIYCNNIKNIYNVVCELEKNNNEKLEEIKRAQRKYINFNSAEDVVDFIDSIPVDRSKISVLRSV